MRTINLIKASFTQPKLLMEARHKKGWHIFGYILILALVLSLPVIYQTTQITQSMQQDGEEIIKKMPDFKIVDNTLTPDKKDSGFVYQTNSIIFTFDPDGKRNKQDIASDASGNAFVIGLLKHEAVLTLPQIGTTTDVVDSNLVTIPYSLPQVSMLSKTFIEQMLTGKTSGVMWFVLILIITFVMVLVNFLIDIVLLTFFATLFTKLRMLRLKFTDVFKILIYCATVPAILTVIAQFIWPSISFGSIGLALTLIIYFSALPKIPKIKKK